MNLRTLFYYKYLFIIIITMLAFIFIFAYIYDLFLGNYGNGILYGSLFCGVVVIPFCIPFLKDQKKLEKIKEQSNLNKLKSQSFNGK